MKHCSIHWFRKGLRLHDNPALLAALADCHQLYPIFILDPWFPKNMRVSVNRWRFLVESLRDLDESLRKLNSRIIAENNDKVPLTYARLQMLLEALGPPKQPVPAPTLESLKDCCTPCKDNHDAEYGIPTLEELGQDPKQAGPRLYPGGESEALGRLDLHMNRTAWVCNFQKPQTEPNSLSPSTTVLSPYLKFGCLSVRTFWWRLAETYQGRKHSSPPVSLHGQLLWREFFYTVGAGIPNFHKMEGNPICVQVDWDHNLEYLQAWSEGQTGYPFIDAIMTQLRTEGWIHHLARHAVACFLTRGDLWISWEEGQKVFEELLLDADWFLNAGNWQWLSASAFFHQFFRVYSPIAFGKKTDKGGEYIKKYLPFLRKFPAEYIYEPWKAPRRVQEQAGCVIGRDYPKPIVVHEVVRKRNMERMKAAYARRAASSGAHPEGGVGKKGAEQGLPVARSVAKVLTKKRKKKSS
ncbi:cryptochrome-1-like isoform X2 [Carettochelys insculpta]|uniref:cryptochrome-1-like isoform X2 n=1 Tax=Carettochelys insculpta TaxID=44489 RepID=UPI003EBEA127